MKQMKVFDIPFIGLKEGKHVFEYQIDNTFFDALQYDEFIEADLKVNLVFEKKPTLLELNFASKGAVKVNCDLSGEPFDLPVSGDLSLIVKFGEGYDDGNEEIMYVSHNEHKINVSHAIFEMLVLSVPVKRVHPKVLDGTLESEALKRLEAYKIKKSTTKKEDTTDPRWGKLKDLLIDKKQHNGTSKEKDI
ncbi:MAG: YceD family protein [Flavicella sp.]